MPDTATTEEHRMLQDLVARFVDRELIPLEPAALKREAEGGPLGLTDAEATQVHARCRELGLWGLDVPEAYGGAGLPALPLMAVEEELGRCAIPFHFPPDSPNLHMLLQVASPAQRTRYLEPYARGEARSAIAISEPGSGGDPAAMLTRAVADADGWVINGRKIWVSHVPEADFIILMARTAPGRRAEGVSAFILERGTRGFVIEREIRMIGGWRTYELVFEDCRLPADAILGQPGQGYEPMQLRLNVRRLQMGARCVGIARRALSMLCAQAAQRSTFGVPLADRQAVQWWIADMATRIHACRLMVRDAAARLDAGLPLRNEAGMVKVFGTEMAADAVDHAMQGHGAMGMTKELPLQLFATQVRLMRIYEGPSEVHRMAIARRVLKEHA